MMRGIRRLVVCAAVSGLLAAGAVTVSVEAAHADGTFATCLGDGGDNYKCTVSGTVSDPDTVTANVTDTSSGSGAYDNVTVNWTVRCTDNNSGTLGTAGAPAASATPVALGLTLPTNAADSQCSVSATVSVSPPFTGTNPTGCVTPTAPAPTASPTSTATPAPICPTEFKATLSDTSRVSTSPSPTPSSSSSSASSSSSVHPVKGYAGKCLDDRGNSGANGAAVIIWGCSGSDQAENWSYSNSELIHNGKCLNDKGNGGSGSKVILYSCNGGSNEKWSHLANGELKMQGHNGTLCVDDPRNSTSNGTQLIVYTCKASANQKWSLP